MRISYQEPPTDIQALDEVDRWRASPRAGRRW